jgi:hypothetical protein
MKYDIAAFSKVVGILSKRKDITLYSQVAVVNIGIYEGYVAVFGNNKMIIRICTGKIRQDYWDAANDSRKLRKTIIKKSLKVRNAKI